MQVKTLLLRFTCDVPVRGSADKVRGFFANKFGEHILFHQHLDAGKLVYRTPLIQYKVIDGQPLVVGINQGADILQKIFEKVEYLKIGQDEYGVREKEIILRRDDFGTAESPIPYHFLTPWLALNEKNYELYRRMGSWQERKPLLERILIGNILSLSKSLGYTVSEWIEAEIMEMEEIPTRLKGIPMLGFLGTFSLNFRIPDYWGIGKSVSKGFGTVKRLCNSS